MTKKFNRAIAAGLLALMIAGFTSCDNIVSTNPPDTSNNDNVNTGDSYQIQTGVPYHTVDLPGDVWKSMKADGTAYAGYDGVPLNAEPIPVQLFQEVGLVEYDQNGTLKMKDGKYRGFSSVLMIDEDSKENDVYLIANYRDKYLKSDRDEEAHVTTWKLKYVLDDDDYQALLRLNGDFRMGHFIQHMDVIYEPEIISQTTSTQQFIGLGYPYDGIKKDDCRFPNVYIHDLDYDNKIITYAIKTNTGYKFYDIDLYKSGAIESVMEGYNVTREEVLPTIHMDSVYTPLGECLTSFNVAGHTAGYTQERQQQEVESSTREHKGKFLTIYSQENNFVAAR